MRPQFQEGATVVSAWERMGRGEKEKGKGRRLYSYILIKKIKLT